MKRKREGKEEERWCSVHSVRRRNDEADTERGCTLWLGVYNKQREAHTHTQPFPFLQGTAEAVWSQQPLHGSMTYFKTILPSLVMAKNPSPSFLDLSLAFLFRVSLSPVSLAETFPLDSRLSLSFPPPRCDSEPC